MRKLPTEHDPFLSVIREIHDASLAPDGWSRVVDSVCTLVPGSKGAICGYDRTERKPFFFVSVGLRSSFWSEFNRYYYQIDPWLKEFETFDIGRVFIADKHPNWDTIRQTPFHQDFLVPEGGGGGTAVTVYRDDDRLFLVALCYPPKMSRDLNPKAEAVLTSLAPHFMQAFSLGRHITGSYRSEQKNLLTAIKAAALLIDRVGRISDTNSRAEKLIETRKVIRRDSRQMLRLRGEKSQALLERALKRIFSKGDRAQRYPIRIRFSAMNTSAWLIPFRRTSAPLAPTRLLSMFGLGGQALVLVKPDSEIHKGSSTLSLAFDLSAEEVLLARALLSGFSVMNFAEQNDLTLERGQDILDSMRAKLDCRHTSELVLKLARLNAAADAALAPSPDAPELPATSPKPPSSRK